MIDARRLPLDGLLEIRPVKHTDSRGFFSEVYSKDAFSQIGIDLEWVQDNQSLSAQRHTLRGLHYQDAPFAQDKLVRVLKGRIFDVAVDIRANSPTFGHWVGVELNAEDFNQLLIPIGFAHGFLSLEPDTEILYKVSAPYSRSSDRAIRWNDPAIGIEWPLGDGQPVLSDKDGNAPLLADVNPAFYTQTAK